VAIAERRRPFAEHTLLFVELVTALEKTHLRSWVGEGKRSPLEKVYICLDLEQFKADRLAWLRLSLILTVFYILLKSIIILEVGLFLT